jgi:drug/metabolite transporter (DMT)-like permease
VALALDLVAITGAVFASQMAYSQTLSGIAWGMLLLGEQLPGMAWGAFGLVILGFWLVQPKEAGDEFSVTVPINRP